MKKSIDTFRTLRMHGTKQPNTEYIVTVDGGSVEPGVDELFSFVTNTKFHGSKNIVIDVLKGCITLTYCTATYPALFNGIEGTLTIIQPIAEPIAVIGNGEIKSVPFPITITPNNLLNYEHLMFNGPTRFRISIDGMEIFPGINICAGDGLKMDFNKAIVEIQTDYDYERFPNDLDSKTDLDDLKFKVLMSR